MKILKFVSKVIFFITIVCFVYFTDCNGDRLVFDIDKYNYIFTENAIATTIPVLCYVLIGLYATYKDDVRMMMYDGIYGFVVLSAWWKMHADSLYWLEFLMISLVVVSGLYVLTSSDHREIRDKIEKFLGGYF